MTDHDPVPARERDHNERHQVAIHLIGFWLGAAVALIFHLM
ncbi:hypothetical protein [Massilia sp. BJB1822]|nr:hypothetical protein [Massilia sp. BJB1822]